MYTKRDWKEKREERVNKMSNYNTLIYEDKKLANDFLERNFYRDFRQGRKVIEIFLIGACKANCSYCYLKKHVKDLYPLNLHNYDTIINNLEKTLNWYISNKFCCNFDIFSAEWLTTPLADRVFDTFYNAFEKIDFRLRPSQIGMADNMQFLKNDTLTQKIEYQIERFEKLGISIYISASVDGKYCEYGRTECDDNYYKKLNDFCMKHHFRPHPMISSENIKDWISNYQWWRNNFDDEIVQELMTLEIRDNTWDENTISQLIQYCDFLVDYKFKEFNNNKEEFLKYVFDLYREEYNEHSPLAPYNIIALRGQGMIDGNDVITCSMPTHLTIRMGDLQVSPCHRLYYPELSFGRYNSDETQIIDFEPTNVSLLIAYKKIKRSCLPYCENCKFEHFCLGHCHGAAYEDYGNVFVPPMEVCKMYQSKISFLIYKYYTMNLFDKNGLEFLAKRLDNITYQYVYDFINSILKPMGINIEEDELNVE